MGRVVRGVAAAIAFIGFCTAENYAAVTPERLVVRVFDTTDVPADDRARAMQRAGEILADAEVGVEWYDCSPRVFGMHPACQIAPAPGELAVRFVRLAGSGDARALGEAMIDSSTGKGVLATIYVDRIEAIAATAKVDGLSIVGRVMAHEIGHLLLGVNSHAETGLMRHIWAVKDLVRNRKEDWLFSRAEIDRLRQARKS
jgi:hypothetical protein